VRPNNSPKVRARWPNRFFMALLLDAAHQLWGIYPWGGLVEQPAAGVQRLLENLPDSPVAELVGAGQLGHQGIGADTLAHALLELPVDFQVAQAAHGG